MSIALENFCQMLSLAMAVAMVLSLWTGIAGWGCPNFSWAVQSGQACLAFKNRAPNSGWDWLQDLAQDVIRAIVWWCRGLCGLQLCGHHVLTW